MGNNASQNCHQSEDFAEFLTAYKKKPSKSTSTNYSQEECVKKKWASRFLTVLDEPSCAQRQLEYCKRLRQAISAIDQQQFVKAQTIIRAMDNQEVAEISSKQVFRNAFRVPEYPKFKRQGESPHYIVYGESFQEERLSKRRLFKNISYILVQEFNQEYHPVRTIKESFIAIFEDKFTLRLAQHSDCREQSIHDLYGDMHSDLKFYFLLVTEGCKRIYQSWVLKSLELSEPKYLNMLNDVALLSLFADQVMFEVLFLLTRSVNYSWVARALPRIPESIPVGCFQIRKELEIDGRFSNALALLAKIESICSPKYLVRALANLKHEICNDIDSFYAESNSQKKLGIDSDNLLAITCYLLCQQKGRLLHLLSQMQVLSVIYGEGMSTIFEDSSYMHSVLCTALEIVLGPQLHQNFLLTTHVN